MNLLTRNSENNNLEYHSINGEMIFSKIFEQIENIEELNFILTNLCASIETAANDWYTDNIQPYVEPLCVDYRYLLRDIGV